MNTYQTIISAPSGTDFDLLPDVFKGLSEALDIKEISRKPMPNTVDYNGRMLIQMEIRGLTAAYDVMNLLAAGISGALGQVWAVEAAQTSKKQLVIDENGEPVLVESGYYEDDLTKPIEHSENIYHTAGEPVLDENGEYQYVDDELVVYDGTEVKGVKTWTTYEPDLTKPIMVKQYAPTVDKALSATLIASHTPPSVDEEGTAIPATAQEFIDGTRKPAKHAGAADWAIAP